MEASRSEMIPLNESLCQEVYESESRTPMSSDTQIDGDSCRTASLGRVSSMLIAALALAVCVSRYALRDVNTSFAANRVMMEQEVQWAYLPQDSQREQCALVEEDVDYTGIHLVATLENVHSASMCCSACAGYPECDAWTWGKRGALPGVTDICWLKEGSNAANTTMRKVSNTNVTSGLPHPDVVKFGIIPAPRRETHEYDGVLPKDVGNVDEVGPICPGKLNVSGHGVSTLVNTDGSKVEVLHGNAVVSHMHARTYWGEWCKETEYTNAMYTALNPLGKTIRYTLDISGVGCGCNAAFYLASMPQNSEKGTCGGDYYCDAMSVCGVPCLEIDLQEANMYAWRSTLHALGDYMGEALGYSGSGESPVQRDWTAQQYGPRADCVDTAKPFNVAISFPVNASGDLVAFEVELSQEGKPCHLYSRLTSYTWGWPPPRKNGWPDITDALKAGMTPVMSYWKSADMLWMDGLGEDGRGPCVQDNPDACPDSVRFYNFSVQPYSQDANAATTATTMTTTTGAFLATSTTTLSTTKATFLAFSVYDLWHINLWSHRSVPLSVTPLTSRLPILGAALGCILLCLVVISFYRKTHPPALGNERVSHGFPSVYWQ